MRNRRLLLPLYTCCLAALLSVAGLIFCGKDELPTPNEDMCQSSDECVMGTQCLHPPPLPPCGQDAQVAGRSCRIASTLGNLSDTLITGFKVPSFHLSKKANIDGTAAFTWTPPGEARIMKCALFGCVPEVVEQEEKYDELYGRYRIVNYDKCVLAERLYEPANGTFNVGDSVIEKTIPPEVDKTWRPEKSWEITALVVGCWAFDTSRIIAATALMSVSPKEVFNYHHAIDMNCSSGEKRSCWLDDEQIWGTCNPTCLKRCLTTHDCPPRAKTIPPDMGVPDQKPSGSHEAGIREAGPPEAGPMDAETGDAPRPDRGCPHQGYSCEKAKNAVIGKCMRPDFGGGV